MTRSPRRRLRGRPGDAERPLRPPEEGWAIASAFLLLGLIAALDPRWYR